MSVIDQTQVERIISQIYTGQLSSDQLVKIATAIEDFENTKKQFSKGSAVKWYSDLFQTTYRGIISDIVDNNAFIDVNGATDTNGWFPLNRRSVMPLTSLEPQ
jgi:hypothetical protein